MKANTLAVTAFGLWLASGAAAQPISVTYPVPTLDRWVYPFGGQPGKEYVIPIFGAIEIPGFDDRDGQGLFGFTTSAQVPAGLPVARYRIVSATLTLTVAVDNQFQYDPTFDSFRTVLQHSDPLYLADADAGKPVEVFGVGYRNGWTAQTFGETSTFGGAPIVPPSEGARNCFSAIFDSNGVATDVSRQVRQRFDVTPMATGTIANVAPGAWVPVGSKVVFDLNVCEPTAQDYLKKNLADGQVRLMVSSLFPAQGGPDGGSGAYSAYYTKESPLANGNTAKLDLVVVVSNGADYNNDGFINALDYDLFASFFEAGSPEADYNGDCFVNALDYDLFASAFEQG
ncbi:MAG: hypothetical protein IT432_07740 [Phycisphaerales bacterium]|nr:hypothetical protein [Phycisphaerales bacterium]